MATGESKQEYFNLRTEWACILVIIIAVLISMSDFVFGGKDFGADGWKLQYPWAEDYEINEIRSLSWDCELQHRPWFEFARSEMLHGSLPLWNPYSFGGYPLYANHLIPVFYPPFTISLLLFDGDNIAGWLMIFHHIIYGICVFLLLRVLGVKPWAATLTASALQFTGICFALWLPWGAAISWMPGILACYELYRRTRRLKYLAWGGFLYGIWFMAAYPVIGVHFTYFLTLYIIIRELTGPGRHPIVIVPAMLAIFVTGALISGIQNIPTSSYSKDTYRSMTYKHGVEYVDPKMPEQEMLPEDTGLPPVQSAIRMKGRYLAPVATLRIDYNRLFMGLPIFLLGIFGLFALPRGMGHWRWLFILLAGLSFWRWLFHLVLDIFPLWNMNTYPPREIWHICLVVCAAFGLQGMFEGIGKSLRVPYKILLLAFAFICLAFIALVSSVETKAAAHLYTMAGGYVFTTAMLYFLAAFGFVIIFLMSLFSRWGRLSLFAGIFSALILVGGIPARMYALPYQSDIPAFSPEKKEFIDAVKTATSEDGRLAKVTGEAFYTELGRRRKGPFMANLTTKYRIKDIAGYDSLISKRNVQYLDLIEDNTIKNLHIQIAFSDMDVVKSDLFLALSVSCVLSDEPELPIDTDVVEAGGMYIHRIPNPAPRYYFARNVEFNDGAENVKELLRKNGWVDSRTAIFDTSTLDDSEMQNLKEIDAGSADSAGLTKISETPGSVLFDVDTPAPVLLVLNDPYAEGWEVFIDGNKSKCLNPNFLFRAAYIPEGKHKVEFIYRPKSMITGLVASLAGIAIFLSLLLIDHRNKKLRSVNTHEN